MPQKTHLPIPIEAKSFIHSRIEAHEYIKKRIRCQIDCVSAIDGKNVDGKVDDDVDDKIT